MKKYNKLFTVGLSIAVIAGVLAAIHPGSVALLGSVMGSDRLSDVDVPDVNIREGISGALTFLISFLTLIAVVAIVVAGFVFIMGFGTEGSITRGKKIIIYTIVGILVVLLASVIVKFFTEELPGSIT